MDGKEMKEFTLQVWNQRGHGIRRGRATGERKRPRAVGAAEALQEGRVAKPSPEKEVEQGWGGTKGVLWGKEGTAGAWHSPSGPPPPEPAPAQWPILASLLALARRLLACSLQRAPRSEPTPLLQSLAYIPAAKPWL